MAGKVGRPGIDGPRITLQVPEHMDQAIKQVKGKLSAAEWIRRAIEHSLNPQILVSRHNEDSLDVLTVTDCRGHHIKTIHVPAGTQVTPDSLGIANTARFTSLAGQDHTTLPTKGNPA